MHCIAKLIKSNFEEFDDLEIEEKRILVHETLLYIFKASTSSQLNTKFRDYLGNVRMVKFRVELTNH